MVFFGVRLGTFSCVFFFERKRKSKKGNSLYRALPRRVRERAHNIIRKPHEIEAAAANKQRALFSCCYYFWYFFFLLQSQWVKLGVDHDLKKVKDNKRFIFLNVARVCAHIRTANFFLKHIC